MGGGSSGFCPSNWPHPSSKSQNFDDDGSGDGNGGSDSYSGGDDDEGDRRVDMNDGCAYTKAEFKASTAAPSSGTAPIPRGPSRWRLWS